MIDVVITIPQPAALDTEIVTESEADIQIHPTPVLLNATDEQVSGSGLKPVLRRCGHVSWRRRRIKQ